MRILGAMRILASAAASIWLPLGAAQGGGELHLPLRVLYAPDADTEYAAGWAELLAAHVDEVHVATHATLTPELVRDFDVLVIDGELMEAGRYEEGTAAVPLRLSDLQGHPVLLMGGVGGQVSTAWKLAGSWGLYGCHCLSPWLVLPAGEPHPALRAPFLLGETPRRIRTPKHYLEHDPALPAELDVLRVFAPDPPEPGYVTRGDFRALPDAEWIASGVNSKGAGHAAILRHGAFVLWGFHGPADALTPAGRASFLDALAYAHAHAGRMVENLRLAAPRAELLAQLQRLAPLLERSERAEALAWLLTPGFPAAVLDDPAGAPAWFESVRGHLRMRPLAHGFELDPLCAELGPANDSPAFLERLAGRLERDPDDALARALYRRYVPAGPPAGPTGGASAWLRAHADELEFTDVGGYVWKLPGERADVLRPLRIERLDQEGPVRVRAAMNEEELVVELEIRVGWHLYARSEGAFAGLALVADPRAGFELGELVLPADDANRLTRAVTLRAPVRRTGAGEGASFALLFQACDADSCRRPESVQLAR
jgi:hypothetical protein